MNGLGIKGRVGGRVLKLGRPDFASPGGASSESDRDAVVLADETDVLAEFHLGERLRPGAVESIAALAAQGVTPLLASGDAASKVEADRTPGGDPLAGARGSRRPGSWPGSSNCEATARA